MSCRELIAIRIILAACAASALIGVPARATVSSGLSASQTRGREIYVRGVSLSGTGISALMGKMGQAGKEGGEVPGAVLPCVNCHGENGRGRPEGGVHPTNIGWAALTKPYGVRRSGGRSEPPYDRRLLKRAIAMGIDSGGDELHAAMPRYRLTHEDMEDLIAYLEVIGAGQDPGLFQDRIRIGTLLPRRGAFAARGAAMEAALRAYFAELNEQGGIYNRRIELRVGETAGGPAAADTARRFIEQEQPFALTSVFLDGVESEISALAGEAGIPMVGALTVNPPRDSPANRHVFYLDAGLEGEGGALVRFAARGRGEGRSALVILCRQDARQDGLIENVESRARAAGWSAVRTVRLAAAGFDPPELVRRLRDGMTESLLLMAAGPPEKAIMDEAARIGWLPQVLIPGHLAGDGVFEFPARSDRHLFLAFPTLPSDRTPAGSQEYGRLATKYRLPAEFPAAQLTALSAARILTEALKRAGSDLSREGLVASLEGLRDYHTHLTPPVTYGPNRRVGISGAHIVSVDLAGRTFHPVGDWVEAD